MMEGIISSSALFHQRVCCSAYGEGFPYLRLNRKLCHPRSIFSFFFLLIFSFSNPIIIIFKEWGFAREIPSRQCNINTWQHEWRLFIPSFIHPLPSPHSMKCLLRWNMCVCLWHLQKEAVIFGHRLFHFYFHPHFFTISHPITSYTCIDTCIIILISRYIPTNDVRVLMPDGFFIRISYRFVVGTNNNNIRIIIQGMYGFV